MKRFWKEHREQEDEGWGATAEQKTWKGPPKSEEEVEAILTGVEAYLRGVDVGKRRDVKSLKRQEVINAETL